MTGITAISKGDACSRANPVPACLRPAGNGHAIAWRFPMPVQSWVDDSIRKKILAPFGSPLSGSSAHSANLPRCAS
ncbi:hypothetical protein [Pectobacterium brasiliense]|uniref:hypothetical protein n=1 Tax=Pectobacterium brasiliense TaxID=180957 RepID=UPI001968FB21|nr:hypothetical protein [Pectobacterium brasiliense]MBN3263000.1 hypothetical protein [Pectobacterium brasiliense]